MESVAFFKLQRSLVFLVFGGNAVAATVVWFSRSWLTESVHTQERTVSYLRRLTGVCSEAAQAETAENVFVLWSCEVIITYMRISGTVQGHWNQNRNRGSTLCCTDADVTPPWRQSLSQLFRVHGRPRAVRTLRDVPPSLSTSSHPPQQLSILQQVKPFHWENTIHRHHDVYT